MKTPSKTLRIGSALFCGLAIMANDTLGATPQTNLAAIVRHAPAFNGSGRVEGSVQQLLGENVILNGDLKTGQTVRDKAHLQQLLQDHP